MNRAAASNHLINKIMRARPTLPIIVAGLLFALFFGSSDLMIAMVLLLIAYLIFKIWGT